MTGWSNGLPPPFVNIGFLADVVEVPVLLAAAVVVILPVLSLLVSVLVLVPCRLLLLLFAVRSTVAEEEGDDPGPRSTSVLVALVLAGRLLSVVTEGVLEPVDGIGAVVTVVDSSLLVVVGVVMAGDVGVVGIGVLSTVVGGGGLLVNSLLVSVSLADVVLGGGGGAGGGSGFDVGAWVRLSHTDKASSMTDSGILIPLCSQSLFRWSNSLPKSISSPLQLSAMHSTVDFRDPCLNFSQKHSKSSGLLPHREPLVQWLAQSVPFPCPGWFPPCLSLS